LQIIQANNTLYGISSRLDEEDIEYISKKKQNLKEIWNEEKDKIFKNSFNPFTIQFDSTSSELRGSVQCARGANCVALARLFVLIPKELRFGGNYIAFKELRAARMSMQRQQNEFPFFEDTGYNDQGTGENCEKRDGCMQFIKVLNIPATTAVKSRSTGLILFQNSNLELKLSNNNTFALPPLCSRGARNWMHSIVHAKQTMKRVAQLIGYQDILSQLVKDRWSKLIKTAIFMEKSCEWQWSMLEKHLDPNEQLSEYSKWTARCTIAYLQDHIYDLLRELVYLLERVCYKNNCSNSLASKVDMLFNSIDHDLACLPYPIRRITEQEESKEVFKLCKEALHAGCSPYRLFISSKLTNTGDILSNH
jgi:hypothetical protein